MVSVIIPIYNTEPYLEECIRSVCGQTYRDLEIILINDGSTDGCGEICRRWERLDPRIRYIEKENEGQGAARNLGIRMASGDYLVFVDSDDYISRNLVEQVHQYIVKQEAEICVYAHYGIGDRLYETPLDYKISRGCNIKENKELFGNMTPVLCNKMFSSQLIKNAGITMSNRMCEDLVFNAQLYARAKKICMLDIPLYYYRYRREGNMTTDYGRYMEVEQSIDELNRIFKRAGIFEENWVSLYEISFAMFKEILFRIKKREDFNVPREIKNQYPIFLNSFRKCLKKWFFSFVETDMQEKNYLLVGSYNLRSLVHALLLDEDFLREDYGACSIISLMSEKSEDALPLEKWKYKNAYRKRCVEQDVRKAFCRKKEAKGIDYIVVDLMDEVLDLVEIRDGSYITESEFLKEAGGEDLEGYNRIPFLCEKRRVLFRQYVAQFCQKLKELEIPVIVVKEYLCEKHSMYYDMASFYDEIEEIREQNRELEWCYGQLCMHLPDAVEVDASGFEELQFTYEGFPFGCRPVYYNPVYYQRMAVRMGERNHRKKVYARHGATGESRPGQPDSDGIFKKSEVNDSCHITGNY